ncbi:MAG: hypothetical protein K0U98_04390 [Deltaproteobacteria bacterium]|nr:hypothetical protein [Deltaproteobacteria bacterium]
MKQEVPERVAYPESLIAGGASNISVRVYEELSHFLNSQTRVLSMGYPKAYFSPMVGWVKEHVSAEGSN